MLLQERPVDIELPNAVVAAVLVLCRQWLSAEGTLPVTVDEILALTGGGRSQAYDYLNRLKELLSTLPGRPGRPPLPPVGSPVREAVSWALRDYIMDHPGATCGNAERRRYSEGFRRFVVGLTAPGQPGETLSVPDLSLVTGVPLGTLKEWLRVPPPSSAQEGCKPTAEQPPEPVEDPLAPTTVRNVHLRVILTQWVAWEGSFNAFCDMLRTEHRIPYGDTLIGHFLQAAGMRNRKPRRPVEAPWSSDTFRKLFPGAQWLGDGTAIAIHWGNQVFVFNIEPLLDVASNAVVGFTVSDTEDEAALHLAYMAALCTTSGQPPLATTLDNRPSNHSPGAVAGLPGFILLRSTPGRGQSKAPIEGAFGLFQQAMPPLVVPENTPREMARSVLDLIFTSWFRGRNGRPRKHLNGKSPAEVYANARPTPGEIAEALRWFRELQRQQDLARLTREARLDPVRLELLRQGLAELGIADPHGSLAKALAGYAREAIAYGLAVFRTKQELGTLPVGADPGRYLGGIIRQRHMQLELELTGQYLLEQRLRLNDLTLKPLQRAAQRLQAEMPGTLLPQVFVDRALDASCAVDYRFWAQAAAMALAVLPAADRQRLYRSLCQRIAATYRVERNRRQDLIDRLVGVVPGLPP
jgi:hypothetical protein